MCETHDVDVEIELKEKIMEVKEMKEVEEMKEVRVKVINEVADEVNNGEFDKVKEVPGCVDSEALRTIPN